MFTLSLWMLLYCGAAQQACVYYHVQRLLAPCRSGNGLEPRHSRSDQVCPGENEETYQLMTARHSPVKRRLYIFPTNLQSNQCTT